MHARDILSWPPQLLATRTAIFGSVLDLLQKEGVKEFEENNCCECS